MANHKSALKRIRRNEAVRLRNKYLFKTVRNSIKKFKEITDDRQLQEVLPKLVSKIDKLAKKNIIHKNKASNLKSKLSRRLLSKNSIDS